MRAFGFSLTVLASVSLLAGCGGGGSHSGGSGGTGMIAVTLQGGTGSASKVTGSAYTLAVYRNDGKEVDKKAVDLSSGGQQIVNFTKLPTGTLRLHVGVSATSGGVETGGVDKVFEGNPAPAPVTVTVGETPTSVAVVPSTVVVAAGSTRPLYTAARNDTTGDYILTSASDWSWSSDTPTVATVGTAGVVTGVAAGSAKVTAAYGGLTGSADVSVTSGTVTHGKWTVMVYMDAANDLWPEAPANIAQMAAIATNPDVRFIIQWKQVKGVGENTNPSFSGTRRYVAKNGASPSLVGDLGSGVDMASPAALRDFVAWSKAKYPADHYALVLWSHGGGWFSTRALPKAVLLKNRAIIYDEDSGNALNFPDVRSALDAGSLDILAYDACLMQGAESLLEFADRAKVIVGSEDDVPGAGYPYQLVFKPFVDSPDAPLTTLAAGMVSAFVNYYKDDSADADWPIQLSALDSSKASAVATALDGLGSALLNAGSSAGAAVGSVRSASTLIERPANYSYYDLNQIAQGFAGQTSLSASIRSAASTLDAAVQSAVIANAGGNGVRAAPNYHGMSIDFSQSGVINASIDNGGYAVGYNHLQLSALTHWNEFLESTTANP